MSQFIDEYFIHFSDTKLQELDKKAIPQSIVIVITKNTLGNGEEPLGKALMKSYLFHIKNIKPLPKCIIFLNQGITLTTKGSEVLDDLQVLKEKGVELITSSTCLEYYDLKNKLAVGGVSGMREIAEAMHRGENTIVL